MFDKRIIKSFLKGLLTYIPGVAFILNRKKSTSKHSGTQAEFCYTLWLSILVFLKENGIQANFKEIGEIGSGGSLGVGICALLSGCDKYTALEVDAIFNTDQNLKLLDEIILLFRNKTRISNKYSQLNLKITNYEYPENSIQPLFLQENRITEIKNEIINGFRNSNRITIVTNWELKPSLNLDFIFSRAVIEHVKAPDIVYKGISNHLKKSAFMFHDIEFHSHGITTTKNGHNAIPDYIWTIIFGKRSYFLNRWQIKDHYTSINNNGFEIIKKEENYINNSDNSEKILHGSVVLAKKRNE